ncbi:hypothetical protein [Modestobacter sp. SYSU DS0875]
MTPAAAGGGSGLSALFGLLVSDPVWTTVIGVGIGVVVAVVATWWRRGGDVVATWWRRRSGDDRD